MGSAIDKTVRQRPGLKPRRRRHEEDSRTTRERTAPASPTPVDPEARSRREGGPQDRALYVCRCGSAFQALVTASVRCPHCGDAQAW